MQYSKRYIISTILLINLSFGQNVIYPGFFGQDLYNYIQNNYQASSTLGYNNARDVMYSEIDLKPGNQLTGVYSGYSIILDLSQDPSTNAYDQGINCEHTWPQSLGAGSEPMKSDMHHLFPTKSNVNSSRGNDPFSDIPDTNTDKWYRDDYYIETIPNSDIDEYAEKWNPPNQDDERFEPREQQKGDTARANILLAAFDPTRVPEIYVEQEKWNGEDSTEIDYSGLEALPVDGIGNGQLAFSTREMKLGQYHYRCVIR